MNANLIESSDFLNYSQEHGAMARHPDISQPSVLIFGMSAPRSFADASEHIPEPRQSTSDETLARSQTFGGCVPDLYRAFLSLFFLVLFV